jgi:RNA polymerase sigma-70 factor (sigma-E family)
VAIVTRRRTRDEFDRFVAESAEGLLRAAYLIVWDVSEAEDLVQECFFRLARRWPRVRTMEHPRAYARRVLVNLALDASGRHRRSTAELGVGPEVVADQADDGAVLLFGRVDVGADLERALGELTPRQRAVLVLRYFEDLPETQVADLMGCSVGTVKSTTARALDRLREQDGLRLCASGANETETTTTSQKTNTSERSVTR